MASPGCAVGGLAQPSAHDSTVVSAALGLSAVLAVALSFILGRRVASGSRDLTQALRGLAEGPHTHPVNARRQRRRVNLRKQRQVLSPS